MSVQKFVFLRYVQKEFFATAWSRDITKVLITMIGTDMNKDMKAFKFITIVGMLIGVSACVEMPDVSEPEENSVMQEVVIAATHEFDSQTKTVLQNDGSVWWKPNDAIGVFFGNRCFEFYSYNMEDAPSANFVGSIITVQGHNENSNGAISGPSYWGVFPPRLKNEYTTADQNFDHWAGNGDYHTPDRDGESVNVYLPSSQMGVAGTFDSNYFISIAKSDTYNELAFYNLCGGLAFCVESDGIYAVTFRGNAGEILAGSVNVVMDSNGHPVVKEVNNGKTVVELKMPEGEYLEPGKWYYIVMLPAALEEGYTMTFYKDTRSGTRVASESVEISRSVFGRLTNPDKGLEYVYTGYWEGGVNYGLGIDIGGTVWAPVNCGYHPTDYPLGKLYQWGRKYGQGYSGPLYGVNGDYIGETSDATVPTIEDGGVSLQRGQSETNRNVFFTGPDYLNYNWLYYNDDDLWNSGTEENPVKTEYDPCPRGWRVPTSAELSELIRNHSERTTNDDGQCGYWFSGADTYTEDAPQIFLPAAGGYSSNGYLAGVRGSYGKYWSSTPNNYNANYLELYYSNQYYAIYITTYNRANGLSVRCVQNDSGEVGGYEGDESVVSVGVVWLSSTSLKLYPGYMSQLEAEALPIDAADRTIVWSSDNEAVATVDQEGKVTGVSVGTATISATADGVSATCSVTVSALATATADYETYGKGVAIGGTVWAPVNCGYDPTDYPYGKLYQWGRKYGQGYSGEAYLDGWWREYSDATTPEIVDGPVSSEVGQSEDNADKFYISSNWEYRWDWLSEQNDQLWNSGTEDNPQKTEYDPCPEGWRVPTYTELEELCQHYSERTTNTAGQNGIWFSGANIYTEGVPQIFLPAAGNRNIGGNAYDRGNYGSYWSSSPNTLVGYYLSFDSC